MLTGRLGRKLKQWLYRLGWLKPYVAIDRHRYLRRLKRSPYVDSRYLSLHDRAQFQGDEFVIRIDGSAGRGEGSVSGINSSNSTNSSNAAIAAAVPCYFWCNPRSSIEGMLLQYGFFQWSVFKTLAAYVRPGEMVIDVGANIGAIALPLAKAFPDVTVQAFEPNPAMIRRFEQNLALNRMHGSNLHLRPMALSAQRGVMTLFAVDHIEGNPGLSSLREKSLGSVEHTAVSVDVETLDALYLDAAQPVCAIKLDVQGHELQVLTGGREVLKRYKPVIVFEHEDSLFENQEEMITVKRGLDEFFTGMGYRCLYISRYGPDLLAPVTWDQPLNGDVLALPIA